MIASRNDIAVVCTARPSYAKLSPVIRALREQGAALTLYVTSGAVLYRFGTVVDQVAKDFPGCTIYPIYAEYDGYNLVTAAKSTASLLHSLADAFHWRQHRLVVVNHDRREVLAAAQAAAYQNIPVAHIGGGERSGNIDDKVRDAITCLSDYHFPATLQAAGRVMQMVRTHTCFSAEEIIPAYGCPTIDLAREAREDEPVTMKELGGVGRDIDLSHSFILLLQHPHTKEPEQAFRHMMTTLHAVESLKLPILAIWPGADAGADGASKALRLRQDHIHTVRAVPPRRFLRLLTQATVLVGNSSAGIRECSYLGTPVVDIGERQQGRECGKNVEHAAHEYETIRRALWKQVGATYQGETLYGDGFAADRIVEAIVKR